MTSNAALLSRLAGSASPQSSLPSAASWSHLSGGTDAGGSGLTGGESHLSQGKSMRVFATDSTACQTRCRFEVGKDGRRVCVEEAQEGAETCGTRHQGNEVFLEPDSFYLLHSKNIILIEPHFSFQYVGMLLRGVIRSSSYTLEEFSELGFFIRALGDNEGNLITERDIARRRQELKEPLKTPATMKKRVTIGNDGTSRALFGDSPQPPEINVEALREVFNENEWVDAGAPAALVEHIRSIRTATLDTVDSIPGIFRDLSGMHGLLAHDVEVLDNRLGLMQEKVDIEKANPSGMSSDGVEDLKTRLNAMEGRVQEAENKASEATKSQMSASDQEKRIKDLEDQLNATLAALIEMKEDATASRPPRVEFKSTTKSAVDEKLEILQRQVDSLMNGANGSTNVLTVFQELISGIKTIDDVKAYLTRHFFDESEEPDIRGDDDDPTRCSPQVTNQKDFSHMSFGAFTDLNVVLAIAEDLESQSTKGETLKEMEAYEKAGLTHPGEATVAYALRQSAPPILTKGTGTSSNKTYLKALKTAEDWDKMAGGHIFPGLKQKIEANMESIRSEVQSAIAESLSGRLRLTSLAQEMLSRSLEFLKLLSTWMSDTYVELVDVSKFPKQEAWLLVTQIVARILRDLNAAKGGIRTIHPSSSPLINTSKALFAMLNVHEVMAEYRAMDIKNHPAVSSEYVKFLATHVGFNEASSLKDTVKSLGTKITTVEAAAKSASAKATEALNTANYCKSKGGW